MTEEEQRHYKPEPLALLVVILFGLVSMAGLVVATITDVKSEIAYARASHTPH